VLNNQLRVIAKVPFPEPGTPDINTSLVLS